MAGVVCPVAGADYPVAGVMYTVLGKIHSVAGVAGGLALSGRSASHIISDLSTVRLPSCWNGSRPLFDEWGNVLSCWHNQSHSSSHTSHGLCAYNPYCCMEKAALQVTVDIDVYSYRPAHEALVHQRNSIPCGKGTSRYHCMAIYVKHCVSFIYLKIC